MCVRNAVLGVDVTRPLICRKCDEEVRYGRRADVTGWFHREDKDHEPAFGSYWTPEMQAKLDAGLLALRERGKADKKKEAEPVDDEDGPDKWAEVPEPYVTAQPLTAADLAPRSGMLKIYNLATGRNKDKVQGWEVVGLTLAIGPYVGARGQVLSISDSIKMVFRGPGVDNGRRVAVASWRDGAFDFAYTGILKGGTVYTQPANSNALKAWIKEPPP